jgi:glycosyltransferase involved in cell wall biosynthesis
VERIPVLPRGVRGRLRALVESAPMAMLPRPDAIWTSSLEAIAPVVWTQKGPLRRPLILDLDSTVSQLESMSEHYFNRAPKTGRRLDIALGLERVVWNSTTLFLPWSNWAAQSLRAQGVENERIVVLPPGVDLDAWPADGAPGARPDQPLRLLFVGGDFARKGGDLLVKVVQERFAGRCELDIVTRDTVHGATLARVHRMEANSPELRDLYARADVFVLPTQAECFGIASVEAMASGLPIIMSNVGGAPDIVSDGETGWLIAPTAQSLARAIEQALADRERLMVMGRRARARAEERFDGRINDSRVVDLVLDQAERWSGA